jgi:phage terminase small subunit
MKKQLKRMSALRKRTPQQTSASKCKKLTTKQRQFLDNKLKGQSSALAARNAGYSESVARKADAIISSSPGVKTALSEILREAGVTNELLAERMWQGLNATICFKGDRLREARSLSRL